MKSILVTGASGLLGQEVLNALAKFDVSVVAIGHSCRPILPRNDWLVKQGDLTDETLLEVVLGSHIILYMFVCIQLA